MDSEAWLALHLPQLDHYDVPSHLYQQIYECVHDKIGNWNYLDAISTSQDATKDTRGSRKRRVKSSMPLPAAKMVLRVSHEWEFQSISDAQTQLRHDNSLRQKISNLIDEIIIKNTADIGFKKENHIEAEVDTIVKHLHLMAYSIRFRADTENLSYYVLNALGSSLRENNNESNLKVMPLYCLELRKLFSIAWTTKDVASGDELVRPHAGKLALMGLCNKSYWEARFQTENEFDWYCEYKHIRNLLASYVSKTQLLLIVGTGTSRLPAELTRDGYTNVIALDYASSVIQKMQTRCKEKKWNVQFVEADLTQMKGWKSNFVDCVIDKGCLDAMLLKPETVAIETNWKRVAPDSMDDLSDAKNSMKQLARVLKPGGLLFFITFGSPSNRLYLFDGAISSDMEWEILQCLEMSPIKSQYPFSTRFYLFIVQKKVKLGTVLTKKQDCH